MPIRRSISFPKGNIPHQPSPRLRKIAYPHSKYRSLLLSGFQLQAQQQDVCVRCILTNLHARYRHIVSATLTSTSCTCDYNQNVELTSWILSGQPTTQCKTGQTPPAGAITADPSPFGIIRNPDWSIGFYAGTTCGQTPYPTFGASMSGTTWKACQNLPQTTYGGQVSIAIQEWSNLCVLLHLEYGCRDEAYRYCTPTTGCVGNFGSNPRNSNRPYSIAAWQVVTTAKQT